MAKIYISSTYNDLKEYREAVYRMLRKLKHDVIAMEDYVAADIRPQKKCLTDVAKSDIYVGLLAWRYGYIPEEDNPEKKSITELEYCQAGSSNLPRLIFLAERDAPWPDNFKDSITGDGERGQRISVFRDDVEKQHCVNYFRIPDHLAGLVIAGVQQCIEDQRLQSSKANSVQQVMREALQEQLNCLLDDYQKAARELAYTRDEVDRNRLKRRLEVLEEDINSLASKINS